jgi:hypothetical protein
MLINSRLNSSKDGKFSSIFMSVGSKEGGTVEANDPHHQRHLGGPNSDIDVFSPSGAPTTQLQSFQVDKESMAVMERFSNSFPVTMMMYTRLYI